MKTTVCPTFSQFKPACWDLGDQPDVEHGHVIQYWVTIVNHKTKHRYVRQLTYVNFYEGGYTDEEIENHNLTTEDGEPFFYVGWVEETAREGWGEYYIPYTLPEYSEIVANCPVFAPEPAATEL